MDGENRKLISAAERYRSAGLIQEWLDCLYWLYRDIKGEARPYIQSFRREVGGLMRVARYAAEASEQMKRSYFITARDWFEDYLIAMEWERPAKDQFYLPRRFALSPVVGEMQRLADDELDVLGISLPPGVGKSTTAHFFLTWLVGRNPYDAILEGSHSGSFVRGVYDEMLQMFDPHGDYQWSKIFEYDDENGKRIARRVVKTDAQDLMICVDRKQRFGSLEFTSTGAANAGRFRAIQLLYVDDLITGIEEALSDLRLDTKWKLFTSDLLQRMQGLCKLLMVGTRWHPLDPIGRMEELHANDPRAKFLNIPALNAEGESNFDYGGAIGFTKEFYAKQREAMDDITFNALYMGQPVVREGLLYEADSLRWYVEMPPTDPDAIWAVCDTASGKGDDTVMLVFAVYGNDHYLVDCVCSDALPEITDELLVSCILNNKVRMCRFESNAAGGRTADEVARRLREKKWECGITKEWTQTNKQTKIIQYSSWVKARCLFRNLADEPKASVYSKTMRKAMTYSFRGKNKHDDVPDALAQYAIFVDSMTAPAKITPAVQVFDRRNFGF